MNLSSFLRLHLPDILGLIGGIALLMLRSWLISRGVSIGDRLLKRVERWLVRNELERITWLHFKKKAEKTGHQHKSVTLCDEDGCVKIIGR